MNPPNGQTSLDYLNQIAPGAPKRSGFGLNFKTLIAGAIAAIVLVIILSVFAGSLGNSRKEPWQRLNARLATTASVAETAGEEIKSSQLRSFNSNLKLYLSNTQRDVATILTELKITAETTPASLTAEEDGSAMIARLEDGRLNAKYDETYVREMNYQLITILTLLNQLSASSSGARQETMQTAYDNLVPIQEAIDSYSSSATSR